MTAWVAITATTRVVLKMTRPCCGVKFDFSAIQSELGQICGHEWPEGEDLQNSEGLQQ